MAERLRLCVAMAALALATGELRAEPEPKTPVALLPLDAEAKLEIYGQPVASEIARALVAGGIDVVVVGPKMAVPDAAVLIVDGKIAGPPKGEKTDHVTLSIRVRNARDGIVLDAIESKAEGLANIDRAAADLSARVLPVVRTQLAALKPRIEFPAPPQRPPPPRRTPPPLPKPWDIAARGDDVLAKALSVVAPDWSRGLPGSKIELVVKRFAVDRGTVPLARARVHVRIWDGGTQRFDRTVVTDTVVGDRNMTNAALAARVAREVLAIVRPHLVRRGVR